MVTPPLAPSPRDAHRDDQDSEPLSPEQEVRAVISGASVRTTLIVLACGGAVSIITSQIIRLLNATVSDALLSTFLLGLVGLAAIVVVYLKLRPKIALHGLTGSVVRQPVTALVWGVVVLLSLGAISLFEVQAVRTGEVAVATERIILANQSAIRKNQDLERALLLGQARQASITREDIDPHGSYRRQIDALLCSLASAIRALAMAQHPPPAVAQQSALCALKGGR